MKKLLTAIFLFLSLFTLSLSLEVKAEAAMVDKEIYSTGFEDTTTGTSYQGTVTQESNKVNWKIYYGNFTTTDHISGNNSAQIRLYNDKTCGYLTNVDSFQKVSSIKFKYMVSNKGTKFKVSWKDGTESYSELVTPSSTSSAQYEKKFDSLINDFILKIEVDSSSTFPSSKNYKFTIDDIVIYTKEEVSTYNIEFNANGGTFAEGKGTPIEASIGTDKEVTLPTSADLSKTLYETDTKYTTLKGWSDGTTTYESGETVTVSGATTFTAVYEATDKINSVISVEEALKICQLTGNNNTICEFTVSGKVSDIYLYADGKTSKVTIVNPDETKSIILYKMKGGTDLTVGDEIIATGYLINYNDKTPEMNSGCTYVISSKVECANFIKTVTKSSLIVSYDEELNPTNVDLRLGGTITVDSYLSGATYGVLVKEGSVELTAGKTTYATVEEFIAANAGFKYVTCTPARVNESGVEDANGTNYQFAWVLTDMEGHYDTTLTAVMYMIYDDTLYICNAKTTSVLDTVAQYLDPENNFEFTEEQKTVLNNIKA